MTSNRSKYHSMIMILNLCSDILLSVFNDWLVETDLCELDSAVCSSAFREGFLQVLSKVYVEETLNIALDWIAMRGIGLRRMSVEGTCELDAAREKILSRVEKLHYMNVNDNSQLERALKLCPIISSLSVGMGMVYFAPFLSQLRSLEAIYMFSSLEKEEIPSFSEIGSFCQNLKVFHCYNDATEVLKRCYELEDVMSEYSDSCVTAISNLPRLTSVSLEFNDRVGDADKIMKIVRKCENIKHFLVPCWQFTDSHIHQVVQRYPELLSLEVSGIYVTDSSLKTIGLVCKKLTSLDVTSDTMTDEGIKAVVDGCLRLKSLNLLYCSELTEDGLQYVLGYCSHLNTFYAHDTIKTNFAFMNAFEICPSLTLLYVAPDANAQELGIQRILLSNVRDMEDLTLRDGYITMRTQVRSSHCKTLLSDRYVISKCSLNAIFLQCRKMAKVRLDHVRHLDPSTLRSLVRTCHGLTSVAIKKCSRLTSDCILTLVSGCKALKRLEVSSLEMDPTMISEDAGLTSPTVSPLLFLRINKCCIPDWLANAVTNLCPHLRTLECPLSNVSSTAVCNFLQKCNSLQQLNLEDCSNVDANLLRVIADIGRRIFSLNIVGCNKITKRDLETYSTAVENLVGHFKAWCNSS